MQKFDMWSQKIYLSHSYDFQSKIVIVELVMILESQLYHFLALDGKTWYNNLVRGSGATYAY